MKGEIHEKFENTSQSNRENWLHPVVASRRSGSYFDWDISAAWLHVIGAERLKVKKLARDHTILMPLEVRSLEWNAMTILDDQTGGDGKQVF